MRGRRAAPRTDHLARSRCKPRRAAFDGLSRVVLPQLVPAIRASLALGFALSLGELGATLTVYPPGFATVPIVVVGQVDRGITCRHRHFR